MLQVAFKNSMYILCSAAMLCRSWRMVALVSFFLILCLPYSLPGSLPRGGRHGLTTSSLPCPLASRWVWPTGVTGQDQRARRDTDVYLPWPLLLRVQVVAAFYGSPSFRLIILFLVEVPLVFRKELTDTIVTRSQLKKYVTQRNDACALPFLTLVTMSLSNPSINTCHIEGRL